MKSAICFSPWSIWRGILRPIRNQSCAKPMRNSSAALPRSRRPWRRAENPRARPRFRKWTRSGTRPKRPRNDMPNVALSIATWDYDHVRDLRSGAVTAEGIDITYLDLNMHEIFARFLANREWDVSELSFAKYIAEASRPDCDLIALPVFLRREFRYGIIYVN